MLSKNFILQKLKEQIYNGNIVTKIILLNIAIFLVGYILNTLGALFGYTNFNIADLASKQWLYIPSSIQSFVYKPYTLLTYQFLHAGFFHLLSNMIILHYFGNIYITLTHKKKLLPLYLLGGFFAGIFFLIAFNFIPSLQNANIYLVGASGSTMAILAAVATLIPEREIYLFGRFKVKYKWIAVFFLAINLLSISAPGNSGNYAHIGGLVFGALFVSLAKKGIDIAKPMNQIINTVYSFFTSKKEPKITFVNDQFKNKKQFTSTKKNHINTEKKIDAILDKIKENGYEKLTKAEKEFLFNHSNS